MKLTQAAAAGDHFANVLVEGINSEVAKIQDAVIRNAQAELERQIKGRVGEIACNIADRYELERQGHVLTIRVSLEERKKS